LTKALTVWLLSRKSRVRSPSWHIASRKAFTCCVRVLRLLSMTAVVRMSLVRRLTFEVRREQRRDARPGPQKMYTVPVARAWWPAVGPRLDRRVRPRPACKSLDLRGPRSFWCSAMAPRRCALATMATMAWRAFEPPRPLTVRRRTSGRCDPTKPTEDDGPPRSAVFRCNTTVPSQRFRNLRQRRSDHVPSVFVPSDLAARTDSTGRRSRAFSWRRRFVAVQSTPTGADSAGVLHGVFREA